jgi:2,4-dienoyl-CoA reductase-like NADH-dependent reductase (Old Yellow Enzyme family)/NADPH-dependent 2,4-dienoyl-CoA reductase/sulfur reductase-like enzyme
MGVSLAEADGSVSDRLIAYHEEQARGGVGLIIMGATAVAWPAGAVTVNQTAISEDRFIPGLRRLAEAVHRHGARIVPQLHHGGLIAGYAAEDGHPLWAPSAPEPTPIDLFDYFLPEEQGLGADVVPTVKVMDQADIDHVVRQFAQAAARAQAAGLDGVEINSAHGYILSSFISRSSNRRTDAYGGSLENRARLLMEVIAAIRAEVGADFAVWCKLDSREEGKPLGITLDEARQVARMAEAAGVNAITVSAYHDHGQAKLQTRSNIPHTPELNIPAARAIKAEVGVPVIASGRIEPESADARIAEGACDFVAMGRKTLADPHLARKLTEGRAEDVRPCIYCYTCVSAIYTRNPVRCAVNPETGFEYLARAGAPPSPRRVVVVGGGPAGMEAARRLDADGHSVTLLEKTDRLGGTLIFASMGYAANERLLDWLRNQIARSGVDVRMGTAATSELLRSLGPDEVIVATGALRETPPIPGAELPHVFNAEDLRGMMLGETSEALKAKTGLATRIAAKVGAAAGLTANLDFVRKATRTWMPLGQRIVIVGGELVGLELAEFLAERGRSVSVIEEAERLGRGLTLLRRMQLIPELREQGVELLAGARDIRIDPTVVAFVDAEGEARAVPADHVIVAKGARGDTSLAEALRAAGFRVRVIGDANGVGYIEGAMRSAAEAVNAIAVDAELQPTP